MAKKKVMTVSQLVRALGLHGKVGEKVAKEALAQLSAPGDNGKQKHTLTLPHIEQGVGTKRKPGRSAAGSSKNTGVPPKKFRLVYSRAKGIRQLKPPASKSSLGASRIRDAVVKASLGK